MSNPGRTWWGSRFLEALEGFTDSGRLQRGRGYSSDSRILDFAITNGLVTATVRGNVNPYLGVYEEPHYKTRIRMAPISAARSVITCRGEAPNARNKANSRRRSLSIHVMTDPR